MSATEGKPVRLSVEVSARMNDKLEELATKLHTTKADVVRRAVTLIDIAVRAHDEGKKFGVANPDQEIAAEIVGLG